MTPIAQNTPSSLVDIQGQPHYGRFATTVGLLNGREARYLTSMGKPAGRFARHFHYKQFQFFGLISERFLLGCALADTAWLGLAFVYLYDRQKNALHEWTWRSPLARALHLCNSPRQGESSFRQGQVQLVMGYTETAAGLAKHLAIHTPELTLEAAMQEGAFEPMSLCTRSGVNGFTYTNKVAGLPATGHLEFGGEHFDLSTLKSFGHHDFSAGYMRRETFWNWACSSAEIAGYRLGLNLSCGVNETSFSENCLWLDGKLQPLGGVHFRYARESLMQPWTITDEAGKLCLVFRPAGEHVERLDVGVFSSNFHQLFGTFSGHVETMAGRLEIDSIGGFVEEQFAKW